MTRRIRDILCAREGMALVMTLLVMTVVTAMVVEFAYSVHVSTSLLYNWQAMQELSLGSESGASLGAYMVEQQKDSFITINYYSDSMRDTFGTGSELDLELFMEDSKINVNAMVPPNGVPNEKVLAALKRLLIYLELDPSLADSMLDYMDEDNISRYPGAELRAPNRHFHSPDELLRAEGMDRETYDKLSKYVTVFGDITTFKVDINAAELPVLVSLLADSDEALAQRIIEVKEEKNGFEGLGELQSVDISLPAALQVNVYPTLKGSVYRVRSTVTNPDGLKRITECVLDYSGTILYWKQY